MILVALYILGGLYLLLMAAGLFHRQFVNSMSQARRMGLTVLGAGFFILGISYGFYYFMGPAKENRSSQQLIEKYRTP